MVSRRNEIYVVIPARNEAMSLPLVLRDLRAVGGVVVVDNGSTDGTGDVAREAGAMVVREERPGYGSACLAGLVQLDAWAEAGEIAPEIVVFLDADFGLVPPAILLARSQRIPPRAVRATGMLLLLSAVAVLLAMVAYQRLVWWPQATAWERPYFWHRYGFSIATAVDFPVIQTLLVGAWLESIHRFGSCPEREGVAIGSQM